MGRCFSESGTGENSTAKNFESKRRNFANFSFDYFAMREIFSPGPNSGRSFANFWRRKYSLASQRYFGRVEKSSGKRFFSFFFFFAFNFFNLTGSVKKIVIFFFTNFRRHYRKLFPMRSRPSFWSLFYRKGLKIKTYFDFFFYLSRYLNFLTYSNSKKNRSYSGLISEFLRLFWYDSNLNFLFVFRFSTEPELFRASLWFEFEFQFQFFLTFQFSARPDLFRAPLWFKFELFLNFFWTSFYSDSLRGRSYSGIWYDSRSCADEIGLRFGERRLVNWKKASRYAKKYSVFANWKNFFHKLEWKFFDCWKIFRGELTVMRHGQHTGSINLADLDIVRALAKYMHVSSAKVNPELLS